jgi:hypothetical protein
MQPVRAEYFRRGESAIRWVQVLILFITEPTGVSRFFFDERIIFAAQIDKADAPPESSLRGFLLFRVSGAGCSRNKAWLWSQGYGY